MTLNPLSRKFRQEFALMQQQSRDAAFGRIGRPGRRDPSIPLPPGVVRVINDTGATVPRFGVVALGKAAFAPEPPATDLSPAALAGFLERAWMRAVVPAWPTHIGLFGIVPRPIAAGRTGEVIMSGCTPVRLNVGHEGHRFADVSDGGDVLEKLKTGEVGGAEILWKESGTGAKWGYVRVGTWFGDPLLVSCEGEMPLGMPTDCFVHDDAGPTERTIPVWPGIASLYPPLELFGEEFMWANFHRASGLFEMASHPRMLDVAPP